MIDLKVEFVFIFLNYDKYNEDHFANNPKILLNLLF